MKNIVEGIDYRNGDIVQFSIENKRITQKKLIDTKDYTGFQWIAPGLFDLHINGYSGVDFNDPHLSKDDLHLFRNKLMNIGCTGVLITLITNDCAEIERLLSRLHKMKKEDPILDRFFLGYHVEGPFISPNDGPRGAHDKKFICTPNLDWIIKWNKIVDGLLKIVTISPEWFEDDYSVITKIKEQGIIVSIGHTDATSHQVRQAIEHGASMATHLGNGSAPLQDRHHSSYWDLLSDERVMGCFISDGHHLPRPVLTTFTRSKKGNLIIVSDASSSGGLPPGDYETFIGGKVTISKDNRLHIFGNPSILAGSASTVLDCVNNMINYNILTQHEAWDAASIIPKTFVHLNTPSFWGIGDIVDFVFFDKTNSGIVVDGIYNDVTP